MIGFASKRDNQKTALARVALVTLLTVVLSACAVGPKYQRPNVPAPPEFRGATVAADQAESLADARWFEVFKDPQLQELIRTGLSNNYDLREAVARVESSRAAFGVRRADQFPTITASTDATSQRISSNGSFPLPDFIDQTRTFGTVGLNLLSYELDVWGRLRSATASARAQLLATEENQKTVMTTLVGDVATAYFQLLELDSELDVARRTLASREESLQLIRNRERVGLASALDVRQGEQLVQVAGQVIPALEQRIAQTENRIRFLIGESPASITRTRTLTEQEQPPVLPAGLPSSLLERRPDIRAAEQNLVSANAAIGVARAAYFPRISLTGMFGFQSSQLSNLFNTQNNAWQFTPNATQSLFTGGRLTSNVDLAKAQQNIALVQYERSIQNAFREVSDLLIQHEKVRDLRGRQESLVGTLQERSRLSYVRYRGGVDTLLNALDADRDLFNAELGLAQLRRDELVTVVQLYRALGGGWQQ